jgi:hypothetical protein
LVLEDGQGNREAHDLPGPGGTIRISVGEPGCHGAVWKIWATRKKCDVYVAIRSIGGYQKVSWHPSSPGSGWWFQWTSEHVQANPQITDRVIDRWPQPAEIGESGWTKGFSMWTRHQDVVPAPDNESLPADLLWVTPPPEGYAMGLHVVIARPEDLSQRSASELRWVELKGPSFPFAGFSLADRRVVLLVVSRDLVTDAVNHMIEDALGKVIESAPGGANQVRMLLQGAGVHRGLVWANGPDGDRQAWDVAVEQDNVAEQDEGPA